MQMIIRILRIYEVVLKLERTNEREGDSDDTNQNKVKEADHLTKRIEPQTQDRRLLSPLFIYRLALI